MAYFELEGYGRDTGRKRSRTFQARDAEDAIAQASADGTIVDTTTVRRVFPIRHFYSEVVGVSHENADGTSRQVLLPLCRPAETLVLRRDVGNGYSRHAVAVLRMDGTQLGYLPDETAGEICDRIKSGALFLCFASEITGGGDGYFGLNLLIVQVDDEQTQTDDVVSYVQREIGLRVSIPT